MEELIKAIVCPLIDDHEHVQIERQEISVQVTYILTVNKQDMGRIIGRHGQIAEAVRTVGFCRGSCQEDQNAFLNPRIT